MTRTHRHILAISIVMVMATKAVAEPATPTREANSASQATQTEADEVHQAVLAAVGESSGKPIAERMAAISAPMLGRPYKHDAAGEGVPPDPDPVVRYDAFDCLTFVEEVLALTFGGTSAGADRYRHRLRYGDGRAVRYENRNHFMLQEWIPNNLANGMLKDITAELGETHLVEKTVTAKTWKWWKRRSWFDLPDERLPTGEYRLQVMRLGAASEIVDQIPDGAIIITVRESRDYVPIVVTHLGFKVTIDDVPLLRHATRMGAEPRVRNDRLVWYLEHVRWYQRWPVDGITVLMPQEPPHTSSSL